MALDVVREVQVQLQQPAEEAGHMSAMTSRSLARLDECFFANQVADQEPQQRGGYRLENEYRFLIARA